MISRTIFLTRFWILARLSRQTLIRSFVLIYHVFELSEFPHAGENYAQFGTVKSWFYDLYKNLLSTPANTYKELKAKVIARQSFVEVTEELYDEALEVLPPIWLDNGCFMVDEAVTGDVYHVFGRKNGKFYGCLCNKGFALNNF